MVGEACLPSNAYYPRTPDYTLYSEVPVFVSEHFDLSFVYRFISLVYGLGTMTTTTLVGDIYDDSSYNEARVIYSIVRVCFKTLSTKKNLNTCTGMIFDTNAMFCYLVRLLMDRPTSVVLVSEFES